MKKLTTLGSQECRPIRALIVLVVILGLLAGPAAAQTLCQACGRCDQDGDGLIKDSKRCRDRCGGAIDSDDRINDDGDPFCEDPDPEPLYVAASFIEGDFVFGPSSMPPVTEIFVLDDRGNGAISTTTTLLAPVDSGTWNSVFTAACPGLLAAPPEELVADPGLVHIQKSAGDIRIIFLDVEMAPEILQEGIGSAQLTLQLIGKGAGDQHIPSRAGEVQEYTFTMYRIWGESTSKGRRITCGGIDSDILPGGDVSKLLVTAVSVP